MKQRRPLFFSINHLLAEMINLVVGESDPQRHDQWSVISLRMTGWHWHQPGSRCQHYTACHPWGKCHHPNWSRPWPTTNWASLTLGWCWQLIQFCSFARSRAYNKFKKSIHRGHLQYVVLCLIIIEFLKGSSVDSFIERWRNRGWRLFSPDYLCIMHKSEYSWAFKLVHMVFKNLILDKALVLGNKLSNSFDWRGNFLSPWKHYSLHGAGCIVKLLVCWGF